MWRFVMVIACIREQDLKQVELVEFICIYSEQDLKHVKLSDFICILTLTESKTCTPWIFYLHVYANEI